MRSKKDNIIIHTVTKFPDQSIQTNIWKTLCVCVCVCVRACVCARTHIPSDCLSVWRYVPICLEQNLQRFSL